MGDVWMGGAIPGDDPSVDHDVTVGDVWWPKGRSGPLWWTGRQWRPFWHDGQEWRK